ncbi:carboxypeptidase-like regulatory domain-containing protein [Polyangium aurulentum]|uniref:carboxypeptidase-like regulatory domain-containing protein n=1 Tax=Polyangium aurulentum TaxID=2567896 RepID=UPI0019807BA6|nr:carboxypeptidase-like regulatory domain-containing protein [Polyangium aurulentum]UQA57270.1 carboxypeptidase-like regulatory domain-containing protein [Polyangium aurulentum]
MLAAASQGCGPTDGPKGTGGTGGEGVGGTGGTGGAGVGGSGGVGGTGGTGGAGVGGTGGAGVGGTGGAGVGGTGGAGGGTGGSGGMSAICIEGEVQCGAEGVETCTSDAWVPQMPCPQGCAAGACSSGQTSCTPGDLACFGGTVKECNQAGTGWLASSLCLEQCKGGLCAGACTAGEQRCNGDTREVCGAGGAWMTESACALGCAQSVCVESELSNQGNMVTLSGKHVYQGCVTLQFGGTISVPAGQTLEIWAKCLSMAPGTGITLGSGASLRFHAAETIDLAGTISGGDLVWLSAWKSLVNKATLQSANVTLRADLLTNDAGGSVVGNAAALHGTSFTNNGVFNGAVSVMPPEELSSVTHPGNGWWNWTAEGLDVSWDKPFPGALGYYVTLGDAVPAPGTGMFTGTEHITLPADALRHGKNRVRVVAVNGDSIVGTYPIDLSISLNVKPPFVTSMSHPNEAQWTNTPDVFLSWTAPPDAPAGTFVGYRYAWDHRADTIPTAQNGTFTTNQQVLMAGQAPGVWFFHVTALDRLGRSTPLVGHYEVRVGASPVTGNVAGHIDVGGAPAPGVHVTLNGGMLHAYTSASGDYTFYGKVPALGMQYEVSAALPGHAKVAATVDVGANATTVQNFTLVPAPSPGYRLGWEFPLSNKALHSPSFALGSRGRLVWSHIVSNPGSEGVTFARSTGDVIATRATYPEYYTWEQPTEVGWDGTSFYVLDTYACDDNGSFLPGHGWSCLQMQRFNAAGTDITPAVQYATSGQSGSGSAVWNGSTFGTFFVSYASLMFREITASMAFADGLAKTVNTKLEGPYVDLRQSAWTQAVWDGSGYGVLYQFNDCYFARYDANHAQLVAPVVLDACTQNTLLGLIWDGANYHAAYVKSGMQGGIQLRRISTAGALSAPVKVAGSTHPSLAYDQRNLLLAYNVNGKSVLEIRSPVDHSLKQTIDLGPVTDPRVDFNPQTGEAAVIYLTPAGLFVRSLYLD